MPKKEFLKAVPVFHARTLVGVFAGSPNEAVSQDRITVITKVRVFDGDRVIEDANVLIKGSYIQAVGDKIPAEKAPTVQSVINGQGATLMPGLIDSHVHTDMHGLRDALMFGVTTELEMNGHWTAKKRKKNR